MTEFRAPMAVQPNGGLASPPIDAQIPVLPKQEEETTTAATPIPSSNSLSIDGSDGQDKPPRLPRWTRQEILVLIEGKKEVESRGKKPRVIVDGQVNTESKWSAISNYCKQHGVNREPVQCRKRWGNLSGDYKKIKDWENNCEGKSESEILSFWAMRNDLRRENKLPGFFDREVYDILEKYVGGGGGGGDVIRREIKIADNDVEAEVKAEVEVGAEIGAGVEFRAVAGAEIGACAAAGVEVEAEPVFDSGRPCRVEEGGLFSSDFEHSAEEEVEVEVGRSPVKEALLESTTTTAAVTPPPLPPPRHGARTENVPTPVAEKGSASCASGQKRKRSSSEGESDSDLRYQLLSVLERNSRVLTAHVEAQNLNCQLDRNQRKDHADSLIGVLGKLADALGRIADKL
ncbi:hypothetical protein KI387_001303 [Taxus chinensis]|uniref:Myb-like domain-containing protein n=1 Tax=Taxus chinensis TaxID=29808 RepID=A0AA38LNU8_TAXCH|nr:hypothetical protein KI387_001303 [Taxus chinensis]